MLCRNYSGDENLTFDPVIVEDGFGIGLLLVYELLNGVFVAVALT